MNKQAHAGVKTVSAASGLFAEVINTFSEQLDFKAILVVTIISTLAMTFARPAAHPQKITIDITN